MYDYIDVISQDFWNFIYVGADLFRQFGSGDNEFSVIPLNTKQVFYVILCQNPKVNQSQQFIQNNNIALSGFKNFFWKIKPI